MALINTYYVFVKDEDLQRGVSVSEHPVESGLSLTDNIKRAPVVLKLKGEIVGADAPTVLSKITTLHQTGGFVKYVGRNILNNGVITSFNTSHPNTIYGGCSFDMEISEIRIAKSPVSNTNGGTKQVTKNSTKLPKTYTVKKGDTLWSIARSFYGSGAKYTKIMKKNKLTSTVIKKGKKLKIPK